MTKSLNFIKIPNIYQTFQFKGLLKYILILMVLNYIKLISSKTNKKNTNSDNSDLLDNDEDENHKIKLPTHLDEEEYKLIEINNDNFNDTILKADHFFLLIHNPWCKFSQKMEDKLVGIHKILKLEMQPYYIGKLDSSIVDTNKFFQTYITEEKLFIPKTYPKFIYFYKGNPEELYNDKPNRDNMLNYIKRKIYKHSIKLQIQDIFDYKIIHDKNAFIFVNGNSQNQSLSDREKLENRESFELFNLFAKKQKNSIFYYSKDMKIIDYLFSKNTNFTDETKYNRNLNILYFSKGKLLDVYLNDRLKVFFEKSLNYFINKHINLNFFMQFSEDTINEVFIKKQPAFILFRNRFDNKTDYLEENLPLLASLDSGLKFIITDISGKYELKLAKLMLISNNNLPSIRILDFNGGLRRYEYEGEGNFDNENVLEFINKWKKGQLKPYYPSNKIDQNESSKKNDIIKKIGSGNFYTSVILSKRNVMVLFYTNWCAHCKKVIYMRFF